MIHQPAIHGNGVSGQVTDIKIVSDQLQKSKQRLNRILAENTGRTIEEISRDTAVWIDRSGYRETMMKLNIFFCVKRISIDK